MTEFLHSPLHAEHEKLGATFTPFGPWEMPLKYDNELDEHRAVRNAAGLFDLSHMGEIWVNGPDAGTGGQTVPEWVSRRGARPRAGRAAACEGVPECVARSRGDLRSPRARRGGAATG